MTTHQSDLEMRQQIRAHLDQSIGVTDPRIVSAAARKVERLTGLLRSLAPLAHSVVLRQANQITFSMKEFVAQSEPYVTEGGYHFPLYSYLKVRPEADGPSVVTTGMFLFGLPEAAMPLGEGIGVQDAATALGELQREMVAEGWWPDDGAIFATKRGPVRLSRVQDALLVVPTDDVQEHRPAWKPAATQVELARYRLAQERCVSTLLGAGTLYRVVTAGGLVVDHHLLLDGTGYAMSNGLSLTVQAGGTPDDRNDRVEVVLFSKRLGPWATQWISWIVDVVRGHDASHPVHPYGRVALGQKVADVAALMVWPWGHLTPNGSAGAQVFLWGLLPILEDELKSFRADPRSQDAWIDERNARRDLEAILERWERVVPR
ncbi:MAG: hypothetical protein QM765_31720 [Myxococcales bacterium]